LTTNHQGKADPLFQRTDALRYRRWRDEERLRRALETAFTDDGGQGGKRRVVEQGLVHLHHD
jgi:hypothetical protein